jgi:drug/metabolite transporter (DMT)-like permease
MKDNLNHALATFYKITNITTCAISSLIWKLKLERLSSEQQYILQALAAAITLFFIMIFLPSKSSETFIKKTKAKFKVHSIKSYVYRAIINAIGVPAMMQALKLTGANEVMAILQLTPVFTAILAVFFLKEKVRLNWILALVFSIGGVIVMLYGGPPLTVSISSDYLQGIGLALFAALSFGVYNIICKKQTDVKDDHFTQAFYCFAFGTLLAIPFSIGKWQEISLQETLWALGSGVIGVLSVVTLFLSYKLSSVVRLSPHSYLRVIITAIAMYLLKDELPSQPLTIAICLILLGNFCVVFEKTFYKITSYLNPMKKCT